MVSDVFRPRSLEHEQQVLVRLADGSLEPSERAAVEAYVASSPEAQVRLARQRRVAGALRAGGPVLSNDARAQLDALLVAKLRRRIPAMQLPTRRWLGPAVLACFAALAVMMVLLAGSGPHPPSLTRAALLAYSPPTGAAPAVDPSDTRHLEASFAGITLPNYGPTFGARPSGQRTDELGGRTLFTVYYQLLQGTQISYSIISGQPLPLDHPTIEVTYHRVEIHGYVAHGLAIVTLVRYGRTCVLAGRTRVGYLIGLAEAPLRSV